MESNKVFVFPCVSREIKNEKDETLANEELKAKLMSEENITNIIKSITDKTSYIIDYNNVNKILKFILDGYYFEIENFTPEGNKYVTIKYKETSADEFKLIDGDLDNDFRGLTILNEQPSGEEGIDYLTLCELVNNKSTIPENSKIKFQLKSLPLGTIDCGELN